MTDELGPWRLVALAVLERAVRDARSSSREANDARLWVIGPDRRRWANLLDLPYWPPPLPVNRRRK